MENADYRGSLYGNFYQSRDMIEHIEHFGSPKVSIEEKKFLGRQTGYSYKGQFNLLWSLVGVPKIYFNAGDNRGWYCFRKLFFCPWFPTSLFGMVEGCKEPDQHQLVYGVSPIETN